MPPETKIPNNSEIDQALKEFEMKSSAEQAQETGQTPEVSSELPRMVRLVMKYSGGIIKEQKQAEYVLLGIAVLMFALSFYFFFGGKSIQPEFTPEQFEQIPSSPNQ
ncbi:MAG: hypothetical protein WC735_03020 [Candidatus Paceibacterota bacterium]|jgi:hypothetical protein